MLRPHITVDQAKEILKLKSQGFISREISQRLNLNQKTVENVICKRTKVFNRFTKNQMEWDYTLNN